MHAAAVYSLDSRDWAETRRTNVKATENVLHAAMAAGRDPIVHVSSTAALMRPRGVVTPDSPLSTVDRRPSTVDGTYIQSKVASERIARDLQADGAPVVIVSPGGAFGPNDPHLSEAMRQLRDVLKGLYPLWTTGGFHGVDVRDVAAVNAAAMTPGQGPRRYIVPGHYLDGPTYFGAIRSITGRRLPSASLATPGPATLTAPTPTTSGPP